MNIKYALGFVACFGAGVWVERASWERAPRATKLDKTPAESHLVPPAWRLGQRWRVAVNGPLGSALPAGSLTNYALAEDIVEMVVGHVPDPRDARYRLDCRTEVEGGEYALYFPTAPFHLGSTEGRDERARAVLLNEAGPSLGYCEYDDCEGLVLAFPMEQLTGPWKEPVLRREMSGRQTKQSAHADSRGVWFTLSTKDRVAIVRWRYGDPWWSSVTMACGSPPETMVSCGMAALLEE